MLMKLNLVVWGAVGVTGLLLIGCGSSFSEADLPAPETPKEAASVVEQAFQPAAPEVREVAEVASEAMRAADYEKAVVSLHALKDREGVTPSQGMVVYQSMVALEAQIVNAMDAGDPRAKQAYETLKKLKRK
jgi:hypothetical protein